MKRHNRTIGRHTGDGKAWPRAWRLQGLILCVAPALTLAANAAGADLIVDTAKTFTALDAADATPGDGCLDVSGNLHILSSGSITRNDWGAGQVPNSSAGAICIRVSGNLEMDPGGSIYAENRVGGGSGGLIEISVGGNVTLHGGAASGAIVSASKTSGAGDTGVGGDILILATGTLVAETNSKILSDSPGPGGDIRVSGASVDLEGAVSTRGSSTTGLGGQIFAIAGGDLTVGDSAMVRSRGQDPGADLVHLQGCNVVVNGLVESSGPGHWAAAPNHVRPPNRAGKPGNSTGGIEVWAGNTITINSVPPHNGELNANIGMSGGANGRSWIDLFARGNINIAGDSAGQSAVHANLILGNGTGGIVTVLSSEGSVTCSGKALEANDGAAGGAGGILTIEADRNVSFNSALIYARGATFGGGGQAGGRIAIRSYNGGISGTADSQLNATGGGSPGQMRFRACNSITYGGASFPTPTVLSSTCGDTLALPVFLPACGASTSPTPDDAFD